MKYSKINILIISSLIFYHLPLINGELNKRLLKLEKDAKGVEVRRSSDCDSLYFVKYYEEKDWFEWFKVFCIKNDKILWTVEPDSAIKGKMGMRTRSGRIFKLSNLDAPILEIFDASHQGNGSMYLFKIHSNKLTLVFEEEHAVDFNYEMSGFYQDSSQVFKNGRLSPYYNDINNDGFLDLILKDSVQTYKHDEFDTEKLISTHLFERRFLWDKRKQTFVEINTQN